ncbi:MAG: hypothetical protein EOP53_05215 [Sphingobacteriales bacterium]|nr:MAG: hypothetical protein EOP53_05215 [Sphingobacteriales bacterium]
MDIRDSLGEYFDTVTLIRAQKGIGMLNGEYDGEAYSTQYVATNSPGYFTNLRTVRTTETSTGKNITNYSFDWRESAGTVESLDLWDGKYYVPEGRVIRKDSITVAGKTYYNVIKLYGGNSYSNIIIDPNIGVVYWEAWAKRPPTGVKKFYLKEYKLK